MQTHMEEPNEDYQHNILSPSPWDGVVVIRKYALEISLDPMHICPSEGLGLAWGQAESAALVHESL